MKKFAMMAFVLMLIGAGCVSPANPQATNTAPAPHASLVTLSETDNGNTVTVKTGDRIQVVLHSTYWEFATSSSDVLKPVSDPIYAPDLAGHIPGSGAGTVFVEYTVQKSGTTIISASRTSCGEALRCTGDQGNFSVTINANQ